MKNKSIWENNNNNKIIANKKFENFKQDILIIGGGISGMNTAYMLKDKFKNITLIDKSGIGSGITKNTTAKITYLQGDILYKLSKEKAKIYLNSQIEAVNIIKSIIEDNNISCDFNKSSSIVFTIKSSGIKKIDKIIDILNDNKIKFKKVKHTKIKSGIKVDDTYVFNPLKYLSGLKEIMQDKVNIYENVISKNISYKDDRYYVKTNNGTIICDKVIVCCHYPFFIVPSFIPIKTYIKREYVNAASVNKSKNYTAINVDDEIHSIRYYNNYLIYTSNNHRLTNKIDYKKNYDKSRDDFYKYFNKRPEYTWMNQDIISNDNLPFIGEIENNLYISCAYNAWGMTNSTIGAKIIYDLITNNYNEYETLFDPKRISINLVFNSILSSFNYLKVYIQTIFNKTNPKYVKIKGIYYGIYTDDMGIKHKVKLICPHMKCNLIFNREEKTWDCPCHGSRFDIDGNIIIGPAKNDLKLDE